MRTLTSITIDVESKKRFNSFCKQHRINFSGLVQDAVNKYIDNFEGVKNA